MRVLSGTRFNVRHVPIGLAIRMMVGGADRSDRMSNERSSEILGFYIADLYLRTLIDSLCVGKREARIAIEAGIEIHCSVGVLSESKLGIGILQRDNE